MSNFYIFVLPETNERIKRTKVKRMCKIVHVAVQIVNECVEKNIPIDYYKTQKLAYLCQVEHLKKHAVPLAPEPIWNWSCGAGFKEIYAFFKKNDIEEENNITTPINKILDLLMFEKETISYVIDTYACLPFEDIKLLYKYDGISIGEIVPLDSIKRIVSNDTFCDNKEENI